MNNAEKFKQIFGLRATELWSMRASDLFAWLERDVETTQTDHIADSGRKAERTAETAQNVQNEDLIQRKAAIDALAKFVPYVIDDVSTESYTNGLTDAYNLICQLPSAQPVLTCKGCRYDGYYKHMQCRNCLRKERDLYEPE